jgi:hypothetical protein
MQQIKQQYNAMDRMVQQAITDYSNPAAAVPGNPAPAADAAAASSALAKRIHFADELEQLQKASHAPRSQKQS